MIEKDNGFIEDCGGIEKAIYEAVAMTVEHMGEDIKGMSCFLSHWAHPKEQGG